MKTGNLTAKNTKCAEKPMLFTGEMVRAILDGSKMKTRRIISPRPPKWAVAGEFSADGWGITKKERCHDWNFTDEGGFKSFLAKCPYGQCGSRIWVRETFARLHDGLLQILDPEPDNGEQWNNGWSTAFRADGIPAHWEHYGQNWKPSIFMPRKLSRINLEIGEIRVERLQDISEADAIAEGIKSFSKDGQLKKYWPCDPCEGFIKQKWCDLPYTAKAAYKVLWEKINGDGSWAKNPWVWVIGFKRI